MDNNPLIEIVGDIRLTPVADPPGKLTGGRPLLHHYVDLGKVTDSGMMRDLLIAAYPRIRESVLPTALDGGCRLLADGALVIEPIGNIMAGDWQREAPWRKNKGAAPLPTEEP